MFQLCFNIVPGQRTIWHFLAKNKDGVKLDLCRALFDAGQKAKKELGTMVHYPIIRDANGKSPMEIALQKRFYNKHFMELFMDKIKDYPIFSIGREV